MTIFKELAAKPGLMALAVHTTDFKGVPVEVALVDFNEKPVYCFRCSIAPGYQMQPGAEAFHGISAEDVAGALSVSGILGELRRVALGAYSDDLPFVVAYDPGFIRDAVTRALKAEGGGEVTRDFFAELAADERRDVKELYSYIAGKPSGKKTPGAMKSPFAWVGLPAALEEQGAATADLDNSAIGQAIRVIRLIKAVARLTPEDLPHLLPDVDAEPPAQDLKPHELDRLTFDYGGAHARDFSHELAPLALKRATKSGSL